MKARNDKLKILRQAWQQIYCLRDSMTTGNQRRAETMSRIRLIGPLGSRPVFLELFEQMVWRLAPAASLLVVALIVVLFISGLTPETDLFSSFMNEPEELNLAQLIGFGG